MAHYTNRSMLTIKQMSGHKRVENTMKYISRISNFRDDEFETAITITDEDIKKLGAAGFTKFDEHKMGETVISYYRKPKRFSAV